ncbi:MAG: hypothetical protein D6695_12100 [Planctomycetota bacterium]|nr:MAG: hypothetical protein D6695_12100 [Planctomycetota bacterium]
MRRHVITTVVASIAAGAGAQTSFPTVFVANDGNLEGSVSSFSIAGDGTPVLIDKVITGARASISDEQPGANTIAIDISPDGRFLATGHASGSIAGDYVSIISVAPDGTMALELQYLMPETTFSLAWVDTEYLAVLQTIVFSTNELVILRFDAQAMTLTEVDRAYCGTFATRVVKHPELRTVYVNDSGTVDEIYSFSVDAAGGLMLKQNLSLSHYPLGIEMDPLGDFLFAAGGISAGGHAFSVFALSDDGTMSLVPGSPFVSPGSSPKGFTVHPDGAMLFVEHGTDATIRSFSFARPSGVPTSLGGVFDVGLQGTLGGSDAWGEYLYVTDESTAIDGLRGLYCLQVDFSTGALTPVTPTPVDTTGITPESVLVWDPPVSCRVDLTGDGVVDFFDVLEFLSLFDAGDPVADFTGDGVLDFFDVLAFLAEFDNGCP